MHEIMNHPWINKGFSGPPETYLPTRKPLQLPLDPEIIAKMTGFDFGDAELITSQLTKVLESEDYHRAVRLQEKRMINPLQESDQKRGVFGFYKRRSSATSRDTLNPPSSEAIQFGSDPINAFHPLVSIYYLAQEKMEREAKEKNPGCLAMPRVPGENPLNVPELAAPEAAYTNPSTYEMAGEKPTGGRSRPRARTHGEDEIAHDMQGVSLNATPTIVEPEHRVSGHIRKESAAAGLLRRFSKREKSERPSHPPPALDKYNTASDTPRKSFSMRRPRDYSQTRDAMRPETAASKQSELLTPPLTDATNERSSKRSHGLGRSVSVNSSDIRRRLTRRGVSEGSSNRPVQVQPHSERKVSFDQQSNSIKDAQSDAETSRPAATVASRAKSMGHSRKESMLVRRARREQARTADVPEETDQDMIDEVDGKEQYDGSGSPSSGMKPVFLKGLFSVSTTSSKPLNFIRLDIIRVLKELGVEFREIKGGFACRHSPSILPPADETAPSGAQLDHHRRRISYIGNRAPGMDEVSLPGPKPKASYPQSEEDSEEDTRAEGAGGSGNRGERIRAAGETSTHVQSDLGGQMTLRFEIFVVKVPLLSLHGIQFKKVDGGTWQYKNMAQKVLGELRL